MPLTNNWVGHRNNETEQLKKLSELMDILGITQPILYRSNPRNYQGKEYWGKQGDAKRLIDYINNADSAKFLISLFNSVCQVEKYPAEIASLDLVVILGGSKNKATALKKMFDTEDKDDKSHSDFLTYDKESGFLFYEYPEYDKDRSFNVLNWLTLRRLMYSVKSVRVAGVKDQNELFYARGEIWKKVAAQLGCFSDPDYLAFITAVLNSHSQKITLN